MLILHSFRTLLPFRTRGGTYCYRQKASNSSDLFSHCYPSTPICFRWLSILAFPPQHRISCRVPWEYAALSPREAFRAPILNFLWYGKLARNNLEACATEDTDHLCTQFLFLLITTSGSDAFLYRKVDHLALTTKSKLYLPSLRSPHTLVYVSGSCRLPCLSASQLAITSYRLWGARSHQGYQSG